MLHWQSRSRQQEVRPGYTTSKPAPSVDLLPGSSLGSGSGPEVGKAHQPKELLLSGLHSGDPE